MVQDTRKRAGSIGTAAGFSFYPSKNLGAWGDGGAMTTSDLELADKVEKIRNYGQLKKYHHTELGWNSRLDSIQAIVLTEKLKFLDQWNKQRRMVAQWYYETLKDKEITTYHESKDNEAVHHLFVITLKNRDHMIEILSNAGVQEPVFIILFLFTNMNALPSLILLEGKVSQTLKYKLQNFFHYPCIHSSPKMRSSKSALFLGDLTDEGVVSWLWESGLSLS